MQFIHILAIAVALAMDAFAVAIAVGVSLKKVNYRQVFRLSWHFGLFQAVMPVIGWMLGMKVRTVVESYDHWVAFTLLFIVGSKMLIEAFQSDEEGESQKKDPTKSMSLVVLSVATSIDALAIGFSISILHTSILFPAIVIGIVAGAFTIAGLHIGTRLGASSKISTSAEIIGALVLFGIGLHILYEHGVFF